MVILGRYSWMITFGETFTFGRFHETSAGCMWHLQANVFWHYANCTKTACQEHLFIDAYVSSAALAKVKASAKVIAWKCHPCWQPCNVRSHFYGHVNSSGFLCIKLKALALILCVELSFLSHRFGGWNAGNYWLLKTLTHWDFLVVKIGNLTDGLRHLLLSMLSLFHVFYPPVLDSWVEPCWFGRYRFLLLRIVGFDLRWWNGKNALVMRIWPTLSNCSTTKLICRPEP